MKRPRRRLIAGEDCIAAGRELWTSTSEVQSAVYRLLRRAVALLAILTPMVTGAADVAASAPQATVPALNQVEALRLSQGVIGKRPADYTLLNRQGTPVRLSSFHGKPTLVSFIYTGCFQVCPTNTRSLREAVENLQSSVGRDRFNVVSIGFNQPFDSPQAMRSFAAQHAIAAPNWDFLSPPADIVGALTGDFGFSYVETPAGFDHVLAVTVVAASGAIYSQVYGDRVTPDKIGEPVRQLLRNAPVPQNAGIDDVIDRIRIICTVYDPTTGKYRYDYGLILEIAGGATFALAMCWFFIGEWWSRRRTRRGKASRLGNGGSESDFASASR